MNKYTLKRVSSEKIEYNGLGFLKDKRSGYYLSSSNINGKRERLHRYVYKTETGKSIPKGHHIHHKDLNKENNDISNLIVLSTYDHESLHMKRRMENDKDLMDKWRKAGVAKAPEWHRSEDGRRWHKEHWENMKSNFYKKFELKCKICGTEFVGDYKSLFCSNKCKSAYRRSSHLDDIERDCAYCGKKFKINKYSKTRCCSRSHSASLRWSESKKG